MPRIGFVKFGARGSNNLFVIFLGLAVAGSGVFFLFTITAVQKGRSFWIDILFHYGIGLGGAVIGSLFVYTAGLKRLYVHSLLTLGLLASAHFLSIPFEYFPLALDSLIIASGAALLVRFICRYPLPKGTQNNVAQ